MPTASDLADLRRGSEGIATLAVRDLEGFWASLNLNRPEAALDALLLFTPALVEQYGDAVAAFAADWYDEIRAAERVQGAFRASVVASPYLDATEGTVRRAASALFTDNPFETLESLTATAPKYVLAAGRETVTRSSDRDPRAAGWQRVVRPSGCSFCRMLAGRGGVYRESSVHFAAHKGCNCAAAPSWDQSAPEVDVRIYEASRRTTGMTPEQKERHNALIRRAIDEYAS